MKKKELFINHIPQIEVEDSKNIPSVIFYGPNGKTFIGSAALANANNQNQINRDFKIDLGFVEPPTASKNTSSRRMFNTATGQKKSAAAIQAISFLRFYVM
jgi:molecular chaperone DnaK (HSP70)